MNNLTSSSFLLLLKQSFMWKVANMKKEIDAIRAKDIAQGGLTQGQQTQIARNEQRISQVRKSILSVKTSIIL